MTVNYTDILSSIRKAMDSVGQPRVPAGPIYGGRPLLSALDHFVRPAAHPSFFGLQVKPSNLFPYTAPCVACDQTGDGGDEATYCPQCKGQGANRYEGCMTDGEQMIVITSPLPKKFQPGWPKDTPVPLRKLGRQ